MLDNKEFDKWAGEYDDSIDSLSKGYPFEGYYDTLKCVHDAIGVKEGKKLLDIGIGTGLLTYELYKEGSHVYGIDFSKKMLILAKEKMPKGQFYRHDFRYGVPAEVKDIKFDYIVSSYAIHHLDESEKVEFIVEMKKLLNSDGKIIIADISFNTEEELHSCKESAGDNWDKEEIYFTAREIQEKLKGVNIEAKYIKTSSCAGVLIID